LATCKQALVGLLADDQNKVIALSGKWGTGKSHLWRDVQKESADEVITRAVYVSLFGLGSVSELKLKIAQSVLPTLQEGGAVATAVANTVSGVKKILKGFSSGFSALDDLALIVAPMMIKDRFIVIDDIERKHEKLSIDEILGFIDDCVQNLGCRILLVLNSDQLADKKFWELFREKVIDQELRLDTSPEEAFDIAAQLTPTAWAQHIKPAVEACGISNIRVIRKVIRVVNSLLSNREELSADILSRVIPSTTLLSAINYKALEDGPDFDFVLNFDGYRMALTRAVIGKTPQTAPEDNLHAKWRLLLDRLGVRGTDDFEQLVVDYLRSGMMQSTAVSKVIDRYQVEGRALVARQRAEDFFEHCWWRPELTEEQLVGELNSILPDVGVLDAFSATSLHDQALKLAGGAEVGRELVDGWIAEFRRRHDAADSPRLDPDSNYFRRPVHPDIAAAIRAEQAKQQANVTVLDVCRKVRVDRGWGSGEEALMRSVTAAEYEAAIRGVVGKDLRLLLLQSMDFLKSRTTYEAHFGDAMSKFLDACRSIVRQEPNSRLSAVIRELFKDSGRESDLQPAAANGQAAGAAGAAGA